jgi:hypothetical protein
MIPLFYSNDTLKSEKLLPEILIGVILHQFSKSDDKKISKTLTPAASGFTAQNRSSRTEL